MSFLIATILLVLWGLGMVTSNSMYGLIHILPVIAFILVLNRVLRPPVLMQPQGNGVLRKYEKPWSRGESHD